MQGQRKSQLHVSKYCPETCHAGSATLTSQGRRIWPAFAYGTITPFQTVTPSSHEVQP
jgi:hypothetical protein